MSIRILSSSAAALAVLAVAGAVLSPVAANASEVGAPTRAEAGITRISNAEGDGVVINGSMGSVLLGDGYARVEHPEGGTWQYGTINGTYSNFKHGTRKHGSTAKNGRGQSQRVTNVVGGHWSEATVGKTIADNQAYYHFS